MAWMWAGVRPIIRLASAPTARGRPSRTLTATTDGSLRTIPRPRTYTTVFAVPRSTAMSRPMNEENRLSDMRCDSGRVVGRSYMTYVLGGNVDPRPGRGTGCVFDVLGDGPSLPSPAV